nr:MAG TPA: hypothetical protein [Caudoviricetes sp.]
MTLAEGESREETSTAPGLAEALPKPAAVSERYCPAGGHSSANSPRISGQNDLTSAARAMPVVIQ